MKPFLKHHLQNPVVLFLGLVLAIVLLDQLIGAVCATLPHHTSASWDWENAPLYRRGLTFAPALNGLLDELWFAETFACILMPIGLLLSKFRPRTRLLPWVFVGIVAIWGMWTTLVTESTLQKENPFSPPVPITEQLHWGMSAPLNNTSDSPDPQLSSYFPYFSASQYLFVIPFAIGCGISRGYEKVRAHLP